VAASEAGVSKGIETSEILKRIRASEAGVSKEIETSEIKKRIRASEVNQRNGSLDSFDASACSLSLSANFVISSSLDLFAITSYVSTARSLDLFAMTSYVSTEHSLDLFATTPYASTEQSLDHVATCSLGHRSRPITLQT
jgi:hypothetical protein